MSEILEKAVAAINDKMAGATFDSSVKFKIEDQGSIVVDSDGVRISEEETDCTLIASLDIFTKILDGDMNATEAYMTGSLKVEGSMSAAMELSSILAKDNETNLSKYMLEHGQIIFKKAEDGRKLRIAIWKANTKELLGQFFS